MKKIPQIYINIFNIRTCLTCLSTVFLLTAFLTPLFAQTSNWTYALGISFSGGVTNIWHAEGTLDEGEIKWKPKGIIGSGIFFETSLGKHFGVHSGLHYHYWQNELSVEGTDKSLISKNHSVFIPAYILHSFGQSICFDILYGLDFCHIFYNTMSSNDQHVKGIQYIKYNLFGVGLQMRLSFPLSKFIHFFIGPHSQFYLTKAINNTQWSDYLYNIQCSCGIIMKI